MTKNNTNINKNLKKCHTKDFVYNKCTYCNGTGIVVELISYPVDNGAGTTYIPDTIEIDCPYCLKQYLKDKAISIMEICDEEINYENSDEIYIDYPAEKRIIEVLEELINEVEHGESS